MEMYLAQARQAHHEYRSRFERPTVRCLPNMLGRLHILTRFAKPLRTCQQLSATRRAFRRSLRSIPAVSCDQRTFVHTLRSGSFINLIDGDSDVVPIWVEASPSFATEDLQSPGAEDLIVRELAKAMGLP